MHCNQLDAAQCSFSKLLLLVLLLILYICYTVLFSGGDGESVLDQSECWVLGVGLSSFGSCSW